ncbi:MAG: hexokinase, partial [Kiritimatiellae bacterium]|nr:hexokinase [Kiritimatiellia bacterium]
FCFSYPAEVSPEGDCKLLMWTKQIKAPGIVGQWVGAELAKRLDPKPAKLILLNDTVATLLAGKATEKDVKYSAYLGFILGTGTNVAYLEKNANIKKLPGLEDGVMIINTESGAFDKIERSAFDSAMDAKCMDPGKSVFEKMIAGVYLGRIGLEVYHAAAKANFFSAKAAEKVLALDALESMDFDNFCAKIKKEGRENPLDTIFADAADAAMARRLGAPVFERAAILTAIHLAAFIIKTGGGTNPASPVCVNVDGSTYYKTKTVDFPTVVKAELDAILKPRNVSYALTYVDDAPMVGAAVAALLKN